MKSVSTRDFVFLNAVVGRDPEYRGHIINTRREGKHWVAHWATWDPSDPEYRMPIPYPKVRRHGGGFLRGPYPSQAKAIAAAKRAVDANIIEVEAEPMTNSKQTVARLKHDALGAPAKFALANDPAILGNPISSAIAYIRFYAEHGDRLGDASYCTYENCCELLGHANYSAQCLGLSTPAIPDDVKALIEEWANR